LYFFKQMVSGLAILKQQCRWLFSAKCNSYGYYFSFQISEVLVNEKWNFVEIKKVKIANLKRYIGYILVEVAFHLRIHFPPPWNDPMWLFFLRFNIVYKAQKTAICLSQIAVFSLTKYLFLQPFPTLNYFSLSKKFMETDKPGLFALFRYSLGCRSPPPFLIMRFSKIRNGACKWQEKRNIPSPWTVNGYFSYIGGCFSRNPIKNRPSK